MSDATAPTTHRLLAVDAADGAAIVWRIVVIHVVRIVFLHFLDLLLDIIHEYFHLTYTLLVATLLLLRMLVLFSAVLARISPIHVTLELVFERRRCSFDR